MLVVKPIEKSRTLEYLDLFKNCFPKQKMSEQFLNWLYFRNPEGYVIGFDALSSGRVIAHYACIPTNIEGVKGLLSLNSATLSQFRGQGIFIQLANLTYERGAKDYRFVIGVANANSQNLFSDKLGFKRLGNLNLRFGNLYRPESGSRQWSKESLEWLAENPRRRVRLSAINENVLEAAATWNYLGTPLKSLIVTETKSRIIDKPKPRYGFTVDWIKDRRPCLQLPEYLKPSPLALIFKEFQKEEIELKSWSCFDFDLI